MRALPQTVPTPVVVLTKLAASMRAAPFSDGSLLEAVPVYVATDFAYVPSAPVHDRRAEIARGRGGERRARLLDRLAVEAVGDRDPRHDEHEAGHRGQDDPTHSQPLFLSLPMRQTIAPKRKRLGRGL